MLFMHTDAGKYWLHNAQPSGIDFLALLAVDLGFHFIDPDLKHASRPKRLPTVLSHAEAMSVINQMRGVPRLMTKILYSSGLRLTECLNLRVKDIDFENRQTCAELVEALSSVEAKAIMTVSPSCPIQSLLK